MEWDKVTLKKPRAVSASDFSGLAPIGNNIDRPQQINNTELLFVENGYNRCHVDHFTNFFDGIRKKAKVEADVMFAVQTAVPAVMCFESYFSGKPIYWDSDNLKTKKS